MRNSTMLNFDVVYFVYEGVRASIIIKSPLFPEPWKDVLLSSAT